MFEEEIIVIEPDDEEEIVVLEEAIEKVYPQLENLEVNPSAEIQVFNHPNSYGYDEVVVNAISGDTLEITPSKEEQTFNGVYTEVKAEGVTSEVDENIKAENIKGGVEILGVTGNIEFIDYWSTEQNTSSQQSIFNLTYYVKELPKYINISNYTRGFNVNNLHLLEKADLREWDLSKLISFSIQNCNKLKEINMSNCDLSSSTNPSINGHGALEKLILKNLKLNSSITDFSYIGSNCRNLKFADLSGIVLPNLTNINAFFNNATSLEYLDIRDLDFLNVTNPYKPFGSIPTNCEIIVKDNANRDWILNYRSDLTNIKTVAELGE